MGSSTGQANCSKLATKIIFDNIAKLCVNCHLNHTYLCAYTQLYLPLVEGNSKRRPNILGENCVKEDQKRSVDIVDSNGPILESTA